MHALSFLPFSLFCTNQNFDETQKWNRRVYDFADEAARKRLNRMNETLKKLETQMEAMEAEISKASELSQWD